MAPRPPTKFSEQELAEYHHALLQDDDAMRMLRKVRGWTEHGIKALSLGWHQDRVLIPVRNKTGALEGVVSYQPDRGMTAYDGGQPKTLYTSKAKRDLTPAPETLDESQPCAIVEGEPDAILCHSLGIQAVAVAGSQGWKPSDPERFARFPRVVLIPDTDQTGRDAMHDIGVTLADFTTVHILDILPGLVTTDTTDPPKGYDLTDHYLETRAIHGDDDATNLVRALVQHAPTWPEGSTALKPGLHNLPDGYGWKPRPLKTLTETPPTPPSIAGLFYPASINMFFAEPGIGKSLIAQAIVKHHHDAHPDARTLWVDFEQTEAIYAHRNRLVGLHPDAHVDYLYDPPRWPQDEAARNHLLASFDHDAYDIIFFDATQGLYNANGLSINDNDDVAALEALVLIPLARTGASVNLLAHVAKDKDGRGRWPIGGQRQLGLVTGAAYALETLTPYAAGKPGIVKVICAKDRHGNFAMGTVAAHIHINGDHDTIDTHIELHPAEELQAEKEAKAEGTFRYTGHMQRISKYIEDETIDAKDRTFNTITKAVGGNRNQLQAAHKTLIDEGYATTTPGPGKSTHTWSQKPFRVNTDPGPPEHVVSSGIIVVSDATPAGGLNAPVCVSDTGAADTTQAPPTEPPVISPEPDTTQHRPIETCIHCKAPIDGTGYLTAGGLYCCHPCARGERCTCGA